MCTALESKAKLTLCLKDEPSHFLDKFGVSLGGELS